MKRALLAADASAASLRAARVLREMALCNPDLSVIILHVVPLPEVLTPAAAAGAPLTLPSRLDDYLHNRVEEVLQKTADALGLPPDRFMAMRVIGVPADAILEQAKQNLCDLIVMGRRGLSPLKELFLGSVSQVVLHKATIPVMIVP